MVVVRVMDDGRGRKYIKLDKQKLRPTQRTKAMINVPRTDSWSSAGKLVVVNDQYVQYVR